MVRCIDPTQFMDLMFSSDGGFSVYSNPQFDKIIDEAEAAVDSKKRATPVKKTATMLGDDLASISVCNAAMVYVTPQSIDFTQTRKHCMELLLIKDASIRVRKNRGHTV